MLFHHSLDDRSLLGLIRSGQVRFAGNHPLRIYGLLTCASGRRMKRANRVFFASETEARAEGFRPCGHCLKDAYRQWKAADQPGARIPG
jgi:methylphosphotriester-DNA--protein-cysteine methyltransferase